jgi:hypothetical protein
MREALCAKYLGRNTYNTMAGEKNVDDAVIPAIYQPTIGSSTYTAYRLNPDIFDYSYGGDAGGPLSDENIKNYFIQRKKLGRNNFTIDKGGGFSNAGMGYYTMGSGRDKNGPYVSYYDDWNINPAYGKSA